MPQFCWPCVSNNVALAKVISCFPSKSADGIAGRLSAVFSGNHRTEFLVLWCSLSIAEISSRQQEGNEWGVLPAVWRRHKSCH